MAKTLEAIVLVGGRGVRLQPLTLSVPKPLLPTAGVPFLAHLLARLHAVGVGHVVLASGYRGDMFARHVQHEAGTDLHIECVTEPEPLGTGGAIRHAAAYLGGTSGDPVLVVNGDVLSGHDITAQVDMHRASGAAATLHLTDVSDPRAFGCVPTDDSGRVTAFIEKSPEPVTNQINAGCYVVDPAIVSRIPAGRAVSVERETFPELLAGGATVIGYVDTAYWRDVGTPGAFVHASRDLVCGRLPSAALPAPPGPSLRLPGARTGRGARLGGGTALGGHTQVGEDAIVEGSVIFDDAEIGDGAVVRDSVVARGARIGAGASLDGAVVGEGADIGARCELGAGVRVWPRFEMPAQSVPSIDQPAGLAH